MKTNNEIFEEFWQTYQWPEEKPVFFRLYYDEETGRPLSYSMEDQPGKYVEITAEQYNRSDYRIKVCNGKLEPLPPPRLPKLVPDYSQGTACHVNDITIIVDSNAPNQLWRLRSE